MFSHCECRSNFSESWHKILAFLHVFACVLLTLALLEFWTHYIHSSDLRGTSWERDLSTEQFIARSHKIKAHG